jgi:hypothetical protein
MSFKVEKKLLPEGDELEDIKIQTSVNQEQIESEIKVMVIGKLENPKIQCLRELQHD